ncbi:ATP-binding protein, partial [Psychrobacter sp. 72-O-c]
MKSIPVKVSGNIINEFSEKVPSYMFAINEVLKNSYDACATLINITYDLNEHTLEVSDNGFGISEESLESLFHIAESSKNYGEKICGDRYQQGEKGLGLLAVFKFGNLVEWETMHKSFSNSIKFEVDKREIIKLSNITDFDLPIEDLNKKGSVGTIVKIVCDEVENQDIIGEFFSSDINTKKITNLFLDSGIKVSFKLIGDSKNSNKDKSISLEKAMNENKKLCIFEVEIDSEKNSSVIFKNKSTIVRKICFDKKELPHSISVKANLKILSLKGSSVKSVNTLFHLTRSQRSSLRPLVYINKVLFNNYELFDPEISRGTQSSKSLPQIIGYLDILTTNSRVSFNADRTQLIENSTVREIEAYLLGLNLFIQEEASKLRREMRKNPSVSLEDLYSDDSSAESSSSESSNSDDSNSDDSNSDDSNSDDSNSDDSNSDDS